jgi:chromosome segregation ATPase
MDSCLEEMKARQEQLISKMESSREEIEVHQEKIEAVQEQYNWAPCTLQDWVSDVLCGVTEVVT